MTNPFAKLHGIHIDSRKGKILSLIAIIVVAIAAAAIGLVIQQNLTPQGADASMCQGRCPVPPPPTKAPTPPTKAPTPPTKAPTPPTKAPPPPTKAPTPPTKAPTPPSR